MDFNFDGRGTSARQINLGGSSSTSSSHTPAGLAKAAREQRAKREENRLQNNAAIKIQSRFRSVSSLKKSRSEWGNQFDALESTSTKAFPLATLDKDQIINQWMHITRLLVFSISKSSRRVETLREDQNRLDSWARMAIATPDAGPSNLLLLPFSIPSLSSSWLTLLSLISTIILSQLSSRPYLLPQESAILYLNLLNTLIDPNGPAYKLQLEGKGGQEKKNVAMILGDRLIRKGFHSALRRHLLNFPIDRKSSSTLEPTISLSLSVFKLFPPSTLPGSSSSSAIIVDSEDSEENATIPTRSFALSTFISQILTIPSLSSRIPLTSIPTLTKFPFFETLENIKSLGNYISLTTGDSALERNPLKSPYLLANLLTLGSKRVPHLGNGKEVKLWLEAITIAQDALDESIFKTSPVGDDGKGKGKQRQEVGFEMLNHDEDSQMVSLQSNRTRNDSNDYNLPLDPSTYKSLTISYSESHLNSILTASNKYPTVTRLPLSFFLNSIFSNWTAEVKEKVLNYIFMFSLTSSTSTTSTGARVQTNTVSSLIKELYKGYIRSSKLSSRILSSNAGNGAKEALNTLVDEKYREDWPSLILLLELYSRALLTIGDDEFYPVSINDSNGIGNNNLTTNNSMSRNPLGLDEIKNLSSILRNLAFSLYWNEGTGILANFSYQNNPSLNGINSNTSRNQDERNIPRIPGMKTSLLNLRNLVTKVLQQLYSRDCRKPFCGKDHWLMVSQLDLNAFIQTVVLEEQELSSQVEEEDQDGEVNVYRHGDDMDLDQDSLRSRSNRASALARTSRMDLDEVPNSDDEDDNPPLPISNRLRNHRGKINGLSAKNLAFLSPRLGVLNNIPFVIPFEVRIEIFRQFIRNDAQKLGISRHNFTRNRRHRVTIRRDHIAQDGFLRLNSLGPSLKGTIEIVFIDQWGQEEAGIDGGGVFKEFLTSLTKEAFDTNRGLWKATDLQELYPNPHSYSSMSESLEWFTFLGRVLGKALYDGILVDIKFAGFFLEKWLGKGNYLDDLASLDNLDKELYKGLIYLKNYSGDVESDFSLNFTVTDDEFGEKKTTELIPGGSSIAVTRENRLSYIYRVSHYRLSTQIQKQCQAFFTGLSELIDPRWLRMLNREELRFLVSGTEEPIDIDDLRANTVYGGYHEKDASVEYFWEALRTFNQERRKSFLKFVTSCPSPPLLGFSQLNPKFAIRLAGEDDTRLPTASTCVNLLKLPRYKSLNQCKEKLIYAIDSGAGFDLS